MKATRFEFRYRVVILAMIYAAGLAAFGSFPLGVVTGRTTWLVLSSWTAGIPWLDLSSATLFVTVTALCCGLAGIALRVWGTAHLGAAAMTAGEMRAGQVIVSGPYRHSRNPLYLGLWLLSVPIVLLMPVAGAVFVLLALSFFLLRIIRGEESHLGEKLGPSYRDYLERVPRILSVPMRAMPRSELRPQAEARPRWIQALAAESFGLGFMACFAVLAWRYNAQLLTRCLLVCFGVSLVVRGLMQPRET